MKLVSFFACALLAALIACKSTESRDDEFELSEDTTDGEAFSPGPIPLLVHPMAEQREIEGGFLYRFMIPVGMFETGERRESNFDRMIVRTDRSNTPIAIALFSYPGFFQGQLPPEPDVMVELFQFTGAKKNALAMTFDNLNLAEQELKKSFGMNIRASQEGPQFEAGWSKVTAKVAMATVNFSSLGDQFFTVQELGLIKFDAKHTTPEQLGLQSDEYTILEKIVSQQISQDGQRSIYNGLIMRKLTVEKLLSNIENQEKRDRIANSYKDEFPDTSPEISEFDSSMDNEIKNEMMKLLHSINKE